MELTYSEIESILDMNFINKSTTGYTLPPGIYEISDINSILKSSLPDEVKVNVTIDDIRLKSNLTTNKTIRFTKRSFFYTILGFSHSQSALLGEIEGFVQLIPGSYKSDEPINIKGIDKIHLKCDCSDGSTVNGVREPILYSFAVSSPPGHKIYEEPRVELFKQVNKSVLSLIIFYLEDDDHKPVDFNGETISFTCQLIKI